MGGRVSFCLLTLVSFEKDFKAVILIKSQLSPITLQKMCSVAWRRGAAELWTAGVRRA